MTYLVTAYYDDENYDEYENVEAASEGDAIETVRAVFAACDGNPLVVFFQAEVM